MTISEDNFHFILYCICDRTAKCGNIDHPKAADKGVLR